MERKEVETFYDAYAQAQAQLGVNQRHREIVHRLVKAGLQRQHTALEVGCGIGTLTGLLAQRLKRGRVVACDISSDSIALAQKRLTHCKNVSFVHTDMQDFDSELTFDWLIFPDVLEHIPQEQHRALFQRICPLTPSNGRMAIHIPHPATLELHRKTNPESLQVIDQSLDVAQLMADAQAAGFRLLLAEAYALWEKPYDYLWLVFEKDLPLTTLQLKGRIGAYRAKLKYLFTQLLLI
jgi:cyclopropane fatty-acyl-phospholipid synthase-like methyltransferase